MCAAPQVALQAVLASLPVHSHALTSLAQEFQHLLRASEPSVMVLMLRGLNVALKAPNFRFAPRQLQLGTEEFYSGRSLAHDHADDHGCSWVAA